MKGIIEFQMKNTVLFYELAYLTSEAVMTMAFSFMLPKQ